MLITLTMLVWTIFIFALGYMVGKGIEMVNTIELLEEIERNRNRR